MPGLRLTEPGTPEPLLLPPEVAVSKLGIVATSGAGKSNAAVALAEEMYDAGIPWVAVDPKGDWWGVRASSDGTGPGLPIPVLGGLHGDVPLEPASGRIIANLIIDRRLTCVLDVSEFDSRQEMWRFLTDFALELLRRNREPLHVFAEEASDYLPQSRSEGGWLPKCISAWRRLVAQGRTRGLGVTLITQRSAKLDKEALDLIETLVAMRATSPRDLKAIRGWVEGHDVEEELVDSLPSLEDGEAWVWSPHRLKLSRRVRFRRRRTFDSGATPLLAGRAAETPAGIADVDLDALKAEMEATIERARAEDPGWLRQQVTEKDREIAKLRRDVGALQQEADALRAAPPLGIHPDTIGSLQRVFQESAGRLLSGIDAATDAWKREATEFWQGLTALTVASNAGQTGARAVAETPARFTPRHYQEEAERSGGPVRVDLPRPRREVPRERVPSPSSLPKAERAMLTALAQAGRPLDKTALGILSNYTPGAGAFNNAIGALRSKGYVEPGFPAAITDAGIEALGAWDPLPTGFALADYWVDRTDLPRYGRAERAHLRVVVERARDGQPALTADEVAEAAGYTPRTGASNNALGRLRTLCLISKGNPVELAAELR